MKIRITAQNVFTQQGVFSTGTELSTPEYTEAFLSHLVHGAGAAEVIEAKIVQPVVENKAIKKVKKKSVKKKRSSSSRAVRP